MRRGRGAGYALLGLAGLLFALAALAAASGAQRLGGRADETAAVAEAAAAFVTAYGTLDPRAPERYRERLLALTGGPLRAAIAAAALAPRASRERRQLDTSLESVAVTALSGAEATAAVSAVQHRRWTDPVLGTPLQEAVRQRVTCRLVREDGRWLVVELRLESAQSVESAQPARREAR